MAQHLHVNSRDSRAVEVKVWTSTPTPATNKKGCAPGRAGVEKNGAAQPWYFNIPSGLFFGRWRLFGPVFSQFLIRSIAPPVFVKRQLAPCLCKAAALKNTSCPQERERLPRRALHRNSREIPGLSPGTGTGHRQAHLACRPSLFSHGLL